MCFLHLLHTQKDLVAISFCPDPCKVWFHMPSSARAARENRLLANVTFPSREAPGTGSMTALFI